MRPALQRLLARPSSLDFLRCLVGTPCPTPLTIRNHHPSRQNRHTVFVRNNTGAATQAQDVVEEWNNERDTKSAPNHEAVPPGKPLRRRGQNREKVWARSHMGISLQSQLAKEARKDEGNMENATSPEGVPPHKGRFRIRNGRAPKLKLKLRYIDKEYTGDQDTKSRSDAEAVPLRKVFPRGPSSSQNRQKRQKFSEGIPFRKVRIRKTTRDIEEGYDEGFMRDGSSPEAVPVRKVLDTKARDIEDYTEGVHQRVRPRGRRRPQSGQNRRKVSGAIPLRNVLLSTTTLRKVRSGKAQDIEEEHPSYRGTSNPKADLHEKARKSWAIEKECANGQCTQNVANREVVPQINQNRKQDEFDKTIGQKYYGRWGLEEWSSVELDFESDLERKTDTLRLLDDPHFQHDLHLWTFLLEYRQKKDGTHGVAVFWQAFQACSATITTAQPDLLAGRLWKYFLNLGFEDPAVMEDICQYVEKNYASRGARWTNLGLYPQVVFHFLDNGTHEEALHWHQRLLPRHPPTQRQFHRIFNWVAGRKRNVLALQMIYKDFRWRNSYTRIVPMLCNREEFTDALMWHDFFIAHGDLPKSFSVVEPLVRHLQRHHIFEAQRVIKSLASLVDFAVPADPDYSDRFRALEDIDPGSPNLEELKNPVAEQDVIDNRPTHFLQEVSKILQKEQPGGEQISAPKTLQQEPLEGAHNVIDNSPIHPLQEVSKILKKEQDATNPLNNLHVDVQKPVELDNPNQNPFLDDLDVVPGWTNRPESGDVPPTKPIHISREMMNLIHGEHYGIKPATYNDQLGARWFASNWVSLDLAISVIHALGVHEIGPLSLHAIALREPGARDVSLRIKQLKDLGISIGNSVFSLAVKYFAQKREDVSLGSLLSSDQHPNEYENFVLQEKLLMEYLYARDWVQYRRTLAILSFRSSAPEYDRANYILRTHVGRQDVLAIYDTLALMKLHGQKVSGKTAAHIIRLLLAPRKPGHRPDLNHDINIRQTVGILKTLTSVASQVRPRSWIEILRRLGMLGQFRDLEHLCLFLVDAYHPSNLDAAGNYDAMPQDAESHHYRHPYRKMFSPAFQKAVVEWGFIHPLKIKTFRQISQGSPPEGPDSQTFYNSDIPMPDVTFGIRLLKTLASKGVWVDFGPIRKAIVHRMIVCYGPLKSNRIYNRNAKITLGLNDGVSPRQSFWKMAAMVDDALGANIFEKLDIEQLIKLRVKKVMMKRMRDREKMRNQVRGIDGLRRELR